jgi:hypothetical protein
VSACDGEGGVGDDAVKVLAHLVLIDYRPDGDADLGGTGQSTRGDAGNDRAQQLLGGREQ